MTYQRTRDSGELLSAYAVLTRLHAHRWASHTPPVGSPHTPGAPHWPTVLKRCGPNAAFIAILALDGEVVAAQLCLTRHRRAYFVVPAIHPNYKGLAPGHALLRHLAQDLTSAGSAEINRPQGHGIRDRNHLDLGRTVPGQRTYKTQYRPHWSGTASMRAAQMELVDIDEPALSALSTPARDSRSVPDELSTPQPLQA